MKCLFVINPVAGNTQFVKDIDKYIGQIILQSDVDTVDVYYTKKYYDAFERCKNLDDSVDIVVAVGGDGTINEVIGGVIESGKKVKLAFLAAGTVNDFATSLDLPRTPHAFGKMFKNMYTTHVDVGRVDHRYFVNVLSGGMFSDIGFSVSKKDKNTFGPMAYYIAGLTQLNKQLSIRMDLKVHTKEETIEEEASLFLIANSSSVGGFRNITPLASINDGKFDLFIIKKCHVGELINLLKDYTFSKHMDNDLIHYVQSDYFEIECSEDIVYDIDGEEGKGFPITVECLPSAIELLVKKP